MGLRFRKRVKVAKGVYVNLSKSGVSTTIKTGKGQSFNIGKNGTYINAGMPGTGMYYREKIGGKGNAGKQTQAKGGNSSALSYIGCGFITAIFIAGAVYSFIYGSPYYIFFWIGIVLCILGLIVLVESSSNKITEKRFDYKKAIVNIDSKLKELKNEDSLKRNLLIAEKECISISQLLYVEVQKLNALKAKNKKKYDSLIEQIETNIDNLIEKLEKSRYNAESGCSETDLNSYSLVQQTLENMLMAQKIYYKTAKGEELTIGSDETEPLEFIQCSHSIPSFEIKSSLSTMVYLYPKFAIVYKSIANFEIFPVEIQSINAQMQDMGWVKDYPLDCEVTNHTYLYPTKDGKRDMRYSYNPQLFHILYGTIKFSFLKGQLYVSDKKSCHEFAIRYANYIKSTNLNEIDSNFSQYAHNQISHLQDKNSYNYEALKVADDVVAFCSKLSTDSDFLEELSKAGNKIVINNEKGEPLLGEKGKVRSLFLLDISYCYGKISTSINLDSNEGTSILYLLSMLLLNSNKQATMSKSDYIDIVRKSMSDSVKSMIKQFASMSFKEGEDDLVVSSLLKKSNSNLRIKYLVLMHRFFSLIAKTDGNITEKEQSFLNHIMYLQGNMEKGNKPISSSVGKPMKKLESLIGLESVKQEVNMMSNFIKVQLSRKQQGLKSTPMSYHCVFTGNPGTGKTTVARILAAIYADLGILKKGHLVETDRSGLVAEYVGQTAVKTNKIIDSALDGILFIDEAYSLANGNANDFGKEAISTLLKRMEDDRDRLVVIIAGYDDEIKNFVDANPGLQSRFNRYIHFPDYTAKELFQIFCLLAKEYDYELDEESSEKVLQLLSDAVEHKDKNFGNGRFVRNFFEKTLERQANRIATIPNPSLADLQLIKAVDCEVNF